MANSSKTPTTPSITCANEECWVLIGQRRGRVWHARLATYSVGQPAVVEFDAASVLEREERRGDIVGFCHTHPSSDATPSGRDLKTMRAWVSAFGKPMLCLIDGTDGLRGYRFDHDECEGQRLLLVERFPRKVLIGVDDAG